MQDWEELVADEDLILTKHFNEGKTSNKFVVIHHNAGTLSGQQCYNVWQTRQASAHYQVDINGRITQHVWDSNTAWHAGDAWANANSIGIEHANNDTTNWTVSDATLEEGAHLVAAICRKYGMGRPEWCVNVYPHSHFSATACPGALQSSQKDAYMKRAQEWYDAMENGTEPGPAPETEAEPEAAAPAAKSMPTYQVHYALHKLGGSWWDEITNWHGEDDADGYAGCPNTKHDMVLAYVTKNGARIPGILKYRAHTTAAGWLPWVRNADYNDDQSGMAGNWGQVIDAVQFYFETPDGEEYQQAWYRTQTTQRAGWLPVVCDDQDYAGNFGEPLDRLQVKIGTSF